MASKKITNPNVYGMKLAILRQAQKNMNMRATTDHRDMNRVKKYLSTGSVIINQDFLVEYRSPNIYDTLSISAEVGDLTLSRLEEICGDWPLRLNLETVIAGENTIIDHEVISPVGKYLLVSICVFQPDSSLPKPFRALISFTDIDALQVSENKFRVLSDVLPQLIWTNDKHGDADYFNARWYEYSGLTYENSYGLGWQAMVHPEDAKLSIARWQEALATETVFDTEYRLRDANGNYKWHIGRNVPFRDSNDKLSGWYGTATDVHALKFAESSLRESEERLRVTMESATDFAIITLDIHGLIRGWNTGAERIFGYRPEEVIGVSGAIIFTEEDRKKNAPQIEMRGAREFGRALDERWHLRKDGTVLFMSGVMTPIKSSLLTGYVKVARDLTDRKAFEQKLFNSEERYRIALEAAEMIAWDYDIFSDKIVWNNETELIGKYASENRLSLFMSFVYEDDKKYVEEKMRNALDKSGVFQAEFRIYTPLNGELKWMNSYGKALHNENNEAYRLVGVMYDITSRKLLEEQKEEFIGIASHELKTPVTSIKAYAEVLQEILTEKNDTTSANLMSKLNAQVDRLNGLIKELLDTTKISEGQLSLKIDRFDMNDLIRERVEELQVITQKHRLHTDLISDGTVTGDRELIAQVLTNLVSNAIKYSPQGGNIFLRSERIENGLMVSIQDSGIGIPATVKERIFERFFRVNTPSVQTYPGMGLGLYITAGIIRRHNGTISVDSELGKGSVFSFSLPDPA